MVMLVAANLVVSATEVAVIVAVVALATVAAASYWTEVVVCLLKAPGPESVHVTPFPDESLEMFTVTSMDWPCEIVRELPPEKLMAIAGGAGIGPLVPELQPGRF